MGKATCCECGQSTSRFTRSEYHDAVYNDNGMCKDCQRDVPRCVECGREFQGINFRDGLNRLKMHKQIHRPRDIQCPVCRSDKRYASGADAVSHLESGYCSGCRGKENAHKQIYDFVSRAAPGIMNDRLMLENGGGDVPQQAYSCSMCSKSFNRLSSLMQHQTNKHGGGNASSLRIGY